MTLYWLFPVAVTLVSRYKYFTLALACAEKLEKQAFILWAAFPVVMRREIVPSIGKVRNVKQRINIEIKYASNAVVNTVTTTPTVAKHKL